MSEHPESAAVLGEGGGGAGPAGGIAVGLSVAPSVAVWAESLSAVAARPAETPTDVVGPAGGIAAGPAAAPSYAVAADSLSSAAARPAETPVGAAGPVGDFASGLSAAPSVAVAAETTADAGAPTCRRYRKLRPLVSDGLAPSLAPPPLPPPPVPPVADLIRQRAEEVVNMGVCWGFADLLAWSWQTRVRVMILIGEKCLDLLSVFGGEWAGPKTRYVCMYVCISLATKRWRTTLDAYDSRGSGRRGAGKGQRGKSMGWDLGGEFGRETWEEPSP